MATQKQIDQLLQESWCASSTLNNAPQQLSTNNQPHQNLEVSQDKFKESRDEYAEESFEDFEESRKTNKFTHSQSELDMSKKAQKAKILQPIAEQPTKQNRKQKLALTVNNKPKKQQKLAKTGLSGVQKLHLTHNYARLQERQRQLLMTTLSQENKHLKNQLHLKQTQLRNLEKRYKVLLDQKAQQNGASVREQTLQKQVTALQNKLEKTTRQYKMQVQKGKYKTKISNTPQNFIPQEEADRRQSQLIDIIDKLKNRLIQSDENTKILQKKLNQNSEYNDQLMIRMRRVQQLEYRIEKMTQQGQIDRQYINLLKQKVKQIEKRYAQEKDKKIKLQVQIRRLQMGHETSNDLIQQLKEVRKQKQLLQKSLREVTTGLMDKFHKKTSQKPKMYTKVQDLQIG